MKHVFIINGQARQEYRDKLNEKIREVFNHLDYVIEYTQHPRHATKIVKKYIELYQDIRFYACGGDGTVYEVVNGIYPHTHVELAIVPIGTGNDFVRSLGYELRDFKELDRFLDPVFTQADLIHVKDKDHEEVAINVVSTGFDAVVAQNVTKFKKVAKHSTAYFLSTIYSIGQKAGIKYSLEVDGKAIPTKEYMFVIIGNGKYYGGGLMPCPNATISDTWLDLCLVKNVPLYKLPYLAVEYKNGTHLKYKQYVQAQKVRQVKITNTEPILIGLDGEMRQMYQPTLTMLPAQIKICLPKKIVQ